MTVKDTLALVGAGALLAAGAQTPALAAGCGCTPPPCCAPPSAPPPPSQPPGVWVRPPGVNVSVGAAAFVNAAASANVVAAGTAGSTVYFGSGGGGGGYVGPGVPGYIQGLNVETGAGGSMYESTRTRLTKVVLEAVCLDDKDVPHPASQVSPDREITDRFDGEVYRCIAGTRMQYTYSEYAAGQSAAHGVTATCAKMEALYHTPDGRLACRPQKPARDCNERSLLRRFGAGQKVLTLMTSERTVERREESVHTVSASAISLDGGVGGWAY